MGNPHRGGCRGAEMTQLQKVTTAELLAELSQREQIYLLIVRNTDGKSIDAFVAEKISGQVDRDLGRLFTLARDHLVNSELSHPLKREE
jgi:hypothetical protein